MRKTLSMAAAVLCLLLPPPAISATAPVSDATQECLDCHAAIHPGIVSGWQASRHAQTTPAAALAVAGLARKVSSTAVPLLLSSAATSASPAPFADALAQEWGKPAVQVAAMDMGAADMGAMHGTSPAISGA